MEETTVSKWFPLHRGWFLEAMGTWEDSWVGPIMRLLIAMWPTGAALDDRDELLARTARVPIKTWLRIRQETGLFWVVKDGKFTQPFLAAEFEVALEKAAKRTERASKGGQAKQEKARLRQAQEIAAAAASSSASSTSSSTPQATLEAHTRAGKGEFLSSGEERREDQRATAVPKPEYVEACFRAYPRERRGKAAANRAVAIPEDARERIVLFLLDRPAYPLLQVFHAIAKTCDIPPSMADFLAEPWDAEATLRAAGGTAGPSRPGVVLESLQAKAAEDEAAWEDMTEEQQAAAMKAHQERMDRITGRRTA